MWLVDINYFFFLLGASTGTEADFGVDMVDCAVELDFNINAEGFSLDVDLDFLMD